MLADLNKLFLFNYDNKEYMIFKNLKYLGKSTLRLNGYILILIFRLK